MIGQTEYYPAKITKVHGNGFYDLVYDELWKGKPVHEKNIASKFIRKDNDASTGDDKYSTVSTAKNKRGRKSKAEKEKGKNTNTEKSSDSHMDIDTSTQVKFGIKQAYEILLEVSSVTMDLFTMHHVSSAPPPPAQVLAQCRGLEDVENMLPCLSRVDIAQKVILNFLELSSSSSVPHVKDAFALTLSLWLNDKTAIGGSGNLLSGETDIVKDYVRNMVE